MFGANELSIVIKARDEASAVFKNVQKNVTGLNTSFGTAVKASTAVATGIGIASAAAGAFGLMAIKSAANMQSIRMGLDAVSGSSAESEKQLKSLREVARLPGLGFTEAIQGSINLQAAGLSANTAERALKSFGNALATVGKGKAELSGVILALTQIASKGKVSAEEINQLNERIPQIRVAMKAAFGTSNTEDLAKLGIDAEAFIEGIIKEFEKLPPVMGGFNIAVENLQDSWNIFLATEGAKVLEWATQFIVAIEKIVTTVLPKLIAGIEAVARFFAKHQVAIYVLAGAIAGALTPALIALGVTLWTVTLPALAAMAIALAPFIIGGAIIGAIVAGIVWLVKNWDMLAAKAREIWEGITGVLKTAFALWTGIIATFLDWFFPYWDETLGFIWAVWKRVWQAVSDFFVGIWGPIKDVFAATIGFIIDKVEAAIELYNKLKSLIAKPISFVAGAIGGGVKATADNVFTHALNRGNGLLGFERGGIVPGAPGTAVPILAHGQERIVPAHLSRQEDQPTVLNFHFHDVVAGDDGIKRLITTVMREINRGATLRQVAGA